jgi:hypothetical protein
MSFGEACLALGVSEAELEKLVAAGEIASVKEGDTLYFTADVIERYKVSRDDPSVLLADEEIDLLGDGVDEIDLLGDDIAATTSGGDVSFGDDLDLSGDDLLSDIGTAPVEDDTVLNMDSMLDDSEATTPIPSEASALGSGDPGDDTLLDTELLDLGDDDEFSIDDLGDLTADDLDDDSAALRGGGARVMQMKRRESHAGWTAVLAVACILLLLPLGVLINLMFLSASGVANSGETWIDQANVLDTVVRSIAGLFG